jgi:hypothetical protein
MAVQAREQLDDEASLGTFAPTPVLRTGAQDAPAAAAQADLTVVTDDDAAHRESMVPKGTFASEVPPEVPRDPRLPSVVQSVRAEEVARSQPVGPARTEATPAAGTEPLPKQQSSSQRLRVARTPERPPFLASEILREDMVPREPGVRMATAVTGGAALLGIVAAFAAGFDNLAAFTLASVFMGLFALARLRLGYSLRAAAVSSLAGLTLIAVSWYRLALGAPSTDLLLTTSTTLLPAALFFRSWYRGSLTARALVGAALVPALLWALFTSHRELLSLEFVWESWLPALTWYLFVILCLLALLSFMGDETTGGCSAWALGLCCWHLLYACVRAALEADTHPAVRVLGIVQPALAAPLAVALAQLLATSLGQRGRRESEPISATP